MGFFASNEIRLNIISDYPQEGNLKLIKHSNGQYQFKGFGEMLNFEHLYWGGFNSSTIEAKSEQAMAKSKNVIGRSIAGGIVGGIPGAVIGGATSKKVSTTKPALTTTVQSPQNAHIVFTNESGEERTVGFSMMFSDKAIKTLESKFNMPIEYV